MSVAKPTPDLAVCRYDVVLAAIPLMFIGAFAITTVLGLSVMIASVTASLLSIVAVADVLFRNPPQASARMEPDG